MTLPLTILLILATAAYLTHLMVLIHNDGYGHRAPKNPPRSHHADAFERHAFIS